MTTSWPSAERSIRSMAPRTAKRRWCPRSTGSAGWPSSERPKGNSVAAGVDRSATIRVLSRRTNSSSSRRTRAWYRLQWMGRPVPPSASASAKTWSASAWISACAEGGHGCPAGRSRWPVTNRSRISWNTDPERRAESSSMVSGSSTGVTCRRCCMRYACGQIAHASRRVADWVCSSGLGRSRWVRLPSKRVNAPLWRASTNAAPRCSGGSARRSASGCPEAESDGGAPPVSRSR